MNAAEREKGVFNAADERIKALRVVARAELGERGGDREIVARFVLRVAALGFYDANASLSKQVVLRTIDEHGVEALVLELAAVDLAAVIGVVPARNGGAT